MNHPSKTRAFTLVELLVVIAIIGVLVAILITAVMSAGDGAQRAKLKKMIGEIDAATGIYQTEFGELPPLNDDSIYIYLTGGGDGKIWDNNRKKTVTAPLSFPDKAFVDVTGGDYRIANPWYDSSSNNDGVIHYGDSSRTDLPRCSGRQRGLYMV